jgi:UrcA family protein
MFKSHRVIVRMVALLALPALFMVESAVAAVTAEVPPTVTVRYDDLNLNSPQGVARLYGRIQNAATAVCRPAEGPQSVSRMHWSAWNKCFYHAIGKAVQAVHNDELSAYHWQRIRGWRYQETDTPATLARR